MPLILLGFSCVNKKKLTYLQSEGDLSALQFEIVRSDYRLQINDVVNIDIRTLNPEAETIFNPPTQQMSNLNAGDIIFYLQGYSVDNQGIIVLPVIGKIKVEGMTIRQLKELIDSKLSQYFQDNSAFARVQLAGIRFSVVGDVSRPGKYVIYQNQATIFDALAVAGDITIVGDRREVQIIRQFPEGTKLFEIDLTDANVIKDPRFLIQPNDIVNIKPLNVKSWGIGTTGWQTLTLGLSAVASALTIIFTLNNLSSQ